MFSHTGVALRMEQARLHIVFISNHSVTDSDSSSLSLILTKLVVFVNTIPYRHWDWESPVTIVFGLWTGLQGLIASTEKIVLLSTVSGTALGSTRPLI